MCIYLNEYIMNIIKNMLFLYVIYNIFKSVSIQELYIWILLMKIFTYPLIQINILCTMGCTPRMRLTCLVEIILNLCVWGMIFQCISVWKRTLFSSVDFPYQSRPKKAAGPIGPVWCGGEVAVLCLRFHAIKRRTDAARGLKWQCFCPVRCSPPDMWLVVW